MKSLTSLLVLFLYQPAFAKVWHVGPTQNYKYCSQVAPLVQDGDTIEIDFATYLNDPQVLWKKNNLLIKGVGGRPRLQAGSIIANDAVNGKGIFVISGSNARVENIEFARAAVMDRNGAGIRQEGVNLHVSGCKFDSNEMGILQGGTIANCTITVEYCEFLNGGSTANPGYQHNIYINHIDTLIFRYNYSYNSIAEGHEFKSRANNNFILYNTIANYQTEDSRNIDLPNGGTTVIMGNIIEQGPNSANTNLIGYGLEGLSNPVPHELYIVNNTFVNKKLNGSFIHVASGTNKLFLKNNIFAGAKTAGLILGNATTLDSSNNIVDDNIANFGFVDANKYDYHLLSNSLAVDAGTAITLIVAGYQLFPDKIYRDTCNFEQRILQSIVDVGAYEYIHPTFTNEFSTPQEPTIFPNPASNYIFIDCAKTKEMQTAQIYNSDGVVVKEVALIAKEMINVSDLPSGIYYLCFNKKTFHPKQFIKI